MKKRYKIPIIIISCIGGIICFALIISFSLIFLSLRQDMSPYHKLFDGKATKWVSQSPEIWFVTEPSDSNEKYYKAYGEMVVDGETISFKMNADGGIGVYFYEEKAYVERKEEVLLLAGHAKVRRGGRLTIKVRDEESKHYKSKYFAGETIVFEKQPIQ